MVKYHSTVDRAFAALGDPTRRAVLERLGAGSATISQLAEPFGMSLPGVNKHVRLLEEAAIVKKTAPDLTPKTWYGMPAYADKDGKVVLFFRNAEKFKERYAMLGFQDTANLDNGSMWPVAFAIEKLTKADEARIAKLLKQAVS